MAFQFKQFSISDDNCAMKVGADAVLLGAWCNVAGATQILDIGTGSGVIALMLAQRTKAVIHAIEIDPPAATQASLNASYSPWTCRLHIINTSLQNFLTSSIQRYDLIVCNPPFFNNSLLSPAAGRNQSRHSGEMPHNLLAMASSQLTTHDGRCCVILPVPESVLFESLMKVNGFNPNRKTLVYPKPGKVANRVMIQFERNHKHKLHEEILIIRNSDNAYSSIYKELTKDFYLNF